MVSPRSSAVARPRVSPGVVDAVVAVVVVLLLGLSVLLTPAFTDYEAEAEPAIEALIAGRFGDAMHLMPFYAGSVLAAAPFGALAHAIGGGDLAVFRAVAIPGAALVAGLAAVAGRWLREAGRDRRTQLLIVAAVALSPCVALSWNYGHFEEPLVAGVGVIGLIVAARGDDRSALIGGALLGLAAGGKLWAVVFVPVALAVMPTRGAALRLVGAAALVGLLVLAPYAIARLDHLGVIAGGTGQIFSKGNVWWFTGTPNPSFELHAETARMFTTDNSARLAPAFVEAHARKVIVLVAVVLSAAWWWRVARGRELTVAERTIGVLALAAAVLWWRALLDPWFQPYYLTAALLALFLVDARAGRFPVLALVAWAAIWLLHGQSAPDLGLDPDQASALSLAWMVPMGLVLTGRALLQSSDRSVSSAIPDR